MIADTGAGTCLTRSLGGVGWRAMWQCTHSIGSAALNGSRARQHLVERDAQRVEVAPSIDRAVHSAGLFGRHVGERAGDGLWRLWRLPLARQARRDPEPHEPDLACCGIDQRIGRLHILVNQPSSVKAAKGGCRDRWRSARTALFPSVPTKISQECRPQDPRAPASSVLDARRGPAAEPPRLSPARDAKSIRARSFSGSQAGGALKQERERELMVIRAPPSAGRGTGRTHRPCGEVRERIGLGSRRFPVRSCLRPPLSLCQDGPGCNHMRNERRSA